MPVLITNATRKRLQRESQERRLVGPPDERECWSLPDNWPEPLLNVLRQYAASAGRNAGTR